MLEDKVIEIEKRWEWRFKRYEDGLKLKMNILNSKRHLDFGCGFGTFPKILAEKYPDVKVYGIDLDKERIEIGKRRYGLSNLFLLHSTKIIGRYDSITVMLTLHEIPDIKKALDDLYRHLNDNGRIMIHDFRKTSKAKYRERYEKRKSKYKESYVNRVFEEEYHKHNRWTLKEFKQKCEKSGFKTLKIEPDRDYWLFYIGRK